MLDTSHGPIPMTDIDQNLKLFNSWEEAEQPAALNPLGRAFGWQVYHWNPRMGVT
jgi:hypothetical protein